jgi:hypothetical protein
MAPTYQTAWLSSSVLLSLVDSITQLDVFTSVSLEADNIIKQEVLEKLITYFPPFKKIKLGLGDRLAVCMSSVINLSTCSRRAALRKDCAVPEGSQSHQRSRNTGCGKLTSFFIWHFIF